MDNEDNKLVGLNRTIFNSIVEYLMTRPYSEVFNLIQELQQGAQVINVSPKEPEESEGE